MFTHRTMSITRDIRRSPHAGLVVVPALLLLALACGDPTTEAPALAGTPPTRPVPAPSATALTPNVGSTGGDTPVVLTGSGFQDEAIVYFGAAPVKATLVFGALRLFTPPHAAGTVDVVVRNPDGGTGTVAGGFTYAAPTTFAFEGAWLGIADQRDGTHQGVELTIENGRLTRLACDDSVVVTFAPTPVVRDGALSYTAADGSVALTGRIVSPIHASGVIRLGHCRDKSWIATKV
jgi:hypothetical protein